MLSGIHFLLTYNCNYECDHCFLYCSPWSGGTFTLAQVKQVLDEAQKMGTVESIFFEGGEALLYYPLLLEAVGLTADMGFKAAMVSNAYMSTSGEDAELWLKPLRERGLSFISLSNDAFHADDPENPASRALEAANKLGIATSTIAIDNPQDARGCLAQDKGEPVAGGEPLYIGRAADKLTEGLPTQDWQTFIECKHEELVAPRRVHVDALGNVHICQGISMGNMWQKPLHEMVRDYHAPDHPVCGPLVEGGPAELARHYGVEPDRACVDECHFCFLTRRALIGRLPEHLAPRQVYGLD